MTTKNDITGDLISTKVSTEKYRDNYDNIFSKSKEETEEVKEIKVCKCENCTCISKSK